MPEHNRPPGHSDVGGLAADPDRVDLTSDFSSSNPGAPASVSTSASAPSLKAGRYQLLDEIARGGMGIIWRATDTTLDREVAIKVLQDKFAPDSGTSHRFASEARITAQLQHPAIPPIHDFGKLSGDRPFLAMKLIKGQTLEELLRRRADPSAERGRFVAVFEQVCQAVAYAHAHKVIHRDLKPGNVMVGSFGEVQVMDWGLAKVLTPRAAPTSPDTDPGETVGGTLIRGSDAGGSDDSQTQAGSILGTLAYMPPEQAAGEIGKIDQRSDVFGLGAILTVILSGKPPYVGPDAEVVRVMAIRGDLSECFARLDGCGAEPELVALGKRCLAFQAAERPRDAEALAKEVARFRAATEERARVAENERAAAEVKAAEQRKRRRWQAVVAAAAVLILALVSVGAWWKDRQAAERERDRAVAAERDRQEALAAINHAEDVLAAGDLAATDLALTQAESRLGADGSSELNTLLAAAKRDRDLVRDLREIEDQSWAPGYAGSPDAATVARRFRAVFERYGLDVGGAGSDAVADTVRASRVSAALLPGLSEWFSTDPRQPHLHELLDRLDPDPDRAAIRAAIQGGDEGRVRALVGLLDGSKTPAWFAVSVGYHPMVPALDGVRLMAASWRTHPDEYLLAYRITRRLWGTGDARLGEMLAWAKVAVALRPNSVDAHCRLSDTWRGLQKWDEAEASARRAVELSRNHPKSIAAYITLGNVLSHKEDWDGAEASYRKAIEIAPDVHGIHFNIGFLHAMRGDLEKAEQWYRKTCKMAPTNTYYRDVLHGLIQRRALLARLDAVVAGRDKPSNPAEAAEIAELLASPRRHYILALKFFSEAFAANPALDKDDEHEYRYKAACCAVLAAAGKDKEMPKVEIDKWGQLTGQAVRWLREDLAEMTSQAKDPKQQDQIKERLKNWKKDPNLVSVRDPASLAAMPSADRKAWEDFWRDVNALLGSLIPYENHQRLSFP